MSARCYTVKQLLAVLDMKRSTFFDLKRRRQLPFLEELQPRLGQKARYRADLVDRYLDNVFLGQRSFMSHRRTPFTDRKIPA